MNLTSLNISELLELLRQKGYRVSSTVSKERLIELIEGNLVPDQFEMNGTISSRRRLETWVDQNRTYIASQLPCRGPLQGKCTQYDCPDVRHIDCYLAAEQGGHFI